MLSADEIQIKFDILDTRARTLALTRGSYTSKEDKYTFLDFFTAVNKIVDDFALWLYLPRIVTCTLTAFTRINTIQLQKQTGPPEDFQVGWCLNVAVLINFLIENLHN